MVKLNNKYVQDSGAGAETLAQEVVKLRKALKRYIKAVDQREHVEMCGNADDVNAADDELAKARRKANKILEETK